MASGNLRYLALRRRLEPLFGLPVQLVIDELYRALSHYSAIAAFRANRDELDLVAGRGLSARDAETMRRGLAQVVLREGQARFVPDIALDSRAQPVRDGVVGELAVPIRHHGATVGVLDVQSLQAGTLGIGDRDLLAWVADHLGLHVSAGGDRPLV